MLLDKYRNITWDSILLLPGTPPHPIIPPFTLEATTTVPTTPINKQFLKIVHRMFAYAK